MRHGARMHDAADGEEMAGVLRVDAAVPTDGNRRVASPEGELQEDLLPDRAPLRDGVEDREVRMLLRVVAEENRGALLAHEALREIRVRRDGGELRGECGGRDDASRRDNPEGRNDASREDDPAVNTSDVLDPARPDPPAVDAEYSAEVRKCGLLRRVERPA